MEPFPLTLASNQLIGFDCGVDNWIFADASYKPSYWLILKRESFSQYTSDRFEPIDLLFYQFDVEALAQIYRLYDTLPPDSESLGRSKYVTKIQALVMSGYIKVFKVSDATAQRLSIYNDTINSDPYSFGLSSDPIDVKRNELAEELGKDIATRWVGKDAADRLHFERWLITQRLIEVWDFGETAVDTVWDLLVGLYDIGAFTITLVGDAIEFSYKLHNATFQTAGNLLTGDQEAAQDSLIEMGLLIGEKKKSRKEFVDNVVMKAKEGYDMMMRLYDDPHSRTLMWDFFNSLHDSQSYREQQNFKHRIVFEIGIEVLLAIATMGAANVIRHGGKAATTTAQVTKGVNTTKRVGPFTLEAIDHMADLSRLLNKPAVKPPQKPPIRVVPEGDSYDAAKQVELSANDKKGTIDQDKGRGNVGASNKINMRSPDDLMGVEPASPELLSAVSKKRDVVIAQPGSEELRMLDYFGAEASVGGANNTHILLRQNPSKPALLEEFLHGTQQRLGITDQLGTSGMGSAETHVKDFMIRHQKMLGLGDEDVKILQTLKDKGL